MYDLIRRTTAWLLRLILGPRTGRHRAGTAPARPGRTSARTPARPATACGRARRPGAPGPVVRRLPAARSPYGLDHVLDGGASALVRPYLLAADRESAQRRRRMALVLAADFGLDLDLHVLGAQGVAA